MRGSDGEYLNGQDGAGDLAPRDVVSRGMALRMAELGTDHCYLDATMLGADADAIQQRFPTFVAACLAAGLTPDRDWVPVSPTTHYTMGGVLTDSCGRTTLSGLMAVGEVASSGLHGANRLASNSLLEGAVIGRRAAQLILASDGPVAPRDAVTITEISSHRADLAWPTTGTAASAIPAHEPLSRASLRAAVQEGAGVARDASGLERLADYLATAKPPPLSDGPEAWELANMALAAGVVVALASRRRESRGAHWRTDYPDSGLPWQVRQVAQLLADGELGLGLLAVTEMSHLRSGHLAEPVGCPTALAG